MQVTPPPLLIGAGLLFWGAATNLMLPAIALALAIESPRAVRARWNFEAKDFERVADLCSIAFLLLMFWQWFGSRNGPAGLLIVLVWLPFFFFSVLLMQRFDARGVTPLSALFWSIRRRAAGTSPPRSLPIDYGYFCVCLVSAACANQRTGWFFPILALLAGYALYPARAAGRRLGAWGIALGVAVAMAYALQLGIVRAQEQVESLVMDYLRERVFGRTDPFHAHTAIGDVGRVKLSDRILFRVSGTNAAPLRLRDGTYNAFAHDSWFAQGTNFRVIAPVGVSSWIIGPGQGAPLKISAWLKRSRAVLPLPLGTYRLDGLNVGHVEVNGFGAVRVSEGPELVLFSARVDGSREQDAGPDAGDLALPRRLEPVLAQVLAEAGGSSRDPTATARSLVEFFQQNFTYTTELGAAHEERRTLERFLLDDRRGHCEYFASAATLLLRAAGVPARYATGYVAEEWSPLERQYLVRARHAHAWTLAWIDGRWREVDATPVGWLALEREGESAWRPVADFFSWLGFRFARWRASGDETDDGSSPVWLLIIVPLAGWVAWRVTHRKRVQPAAIDQADRAGPVTTIIDPLLDLLARDGLTRPPAQPVRSWLATLPLPDSGARQIAHRVAFAYSRMRFDPDGLVAGEVAALEADVAALVAILSASRPAGA